MDSYNPYPKLEDTSTIEDEEIAEAIVENSKNNAVDLNLYKASIRKSKRFYLTPSILKEMRAKELAAAEWHKATESKNPSKKVMKLYLAFSKERKEVKELIRTFNRNRWAKFLDNCAKNQFLGNKKNNPFDINQDFSWDEVWMVLMRLALHKAPGGDGLEVGWYKVLFNDYDVYCPESPMAKALLNLLQTIWRNGKIPKIWNITEIAPIPKKGDLKLLDNYRGIALIPVGMKILGRIIIAKKESFVTFIDFRKAYDTVPIEALLRKLYLCGEEGRELSFSPLTVKDLVLLSDSEVGLRENLLVVEKWANDNEISFGISKYGALVGKRVPILKKYWYLGVLINDELDLLKFCRQKVEKAEACYTNIRRLLSSKSEARMRYGGEILGMFRDMSRNLQRIFNNRLKNLLGVSERATIVNMDNIWLEFEVPPLYASFGYSRARAYQKFQDVSTPIAMLLKDRSKGSRGKVSNGWLNRMGLE
ncbi:hypothetical protein AYI69_g6746, partial [Smittium culicis]